MARRAKLTQEMVDQAIRLKADGLSNGDIIYASGIHESTFYRGVGEPKNRLQRELSEGLKKEEAEFKHTLLTTIRAAALARNQYWTAAAWLLERKYPDEYDKADRRRDEDEGGDAPRSAKASLARGTAWTGGGSQTRGASCGAGGCPGSGGCSCSRSCRRTGRRRPRPGTWRPRR